MNKLFFGVFMDENELCLHVANFLRKNFFNIYFEVEINNKSDIDIPNITTGQTKVRIDLAAWSRLDSSITFFEAERNLFAKHPIIYKPFADYVYLVCPYDSITSVSKEMKKTQFELLKLNMLGLIAVKNSGELLEIILPKKLKMDPNIRQVVIDKFSDIEYKTSLNNGFIPKNKFPWFSTYFKMINEEKNKEVIY